jgi:hypothetical protein
MTKVIEFMSSVAGRSARVVLGLILIGIGIYIGSWGLILSLIGLIPLILGATNKCALNLAVRPHLQH